MPAWNLLQSNKFFHALCILIIGLYLSPYFIQGDNVAVAVQDNMESNLIWIKLIVESGEAFGQGNGIIEPIMGGVPSEALVMVYNLTLLVFSLFPTFWAYVIIKVLIAFTAYFGMFKLLRENIKNIETEPLILFGTSLCFAVLPFWGLGLNVAYLPFLIAACANIIKARNNWSDWLIVGLAGFLTGMVLVGVFFIFTLFIYAVYKSFFYGKNLRRPVALLSVLTLSYIAANFELFRAQFSSDGFISHRSEFDMSFPVLEIGFERFVHLFFEGQYHSSSMHLLFLPFILIAIILLVRKGMVDWRFLLGLEFLVLTSMFYGFIKWKGLTPLTDPLSAVLPFQLQRFHFLHPPVWFFLFALSAMLVIKNYRFGKILIAVLICIQISWQFNYFESFGRTPKMRYHSFYAPELYAEIDQFIGEDKSSYRVMNIQMHPAIAQYNGFYTLDGYLPSYPLSYKHQFREIIDGELNKAPEIDHYFSIWGSRAYAFVAGYGKDFLQRKKLSGNQSIHSLNYNWNAFKNLGGKYILSPLPIQDDHLELLKSFDHKRSAWKIWLYKPVEEN